VTNLFGLTARSQTTFSVCHPAPEFCRIPVVVEAGEVGKFQLPWNAKLASHNYWTVVIASVANQSTHGYG
jgi:hypothetical protein